MFLNVGRRTTRTRRRSRRRRRRKGIITYLDLAWLQVFGIFFFVETLLSVIKTDTFQIASLGLPLSNNKLRFTLLRVSSFWGFLRVTLDDDGHSRRRSLLLVMMEKNGSSSSKKGDNKEVVPELERSKEYTLIYDKAIHSNPNNAYLYLLRAIQHCFEKNFIGKKNSLSVSTRRRRGGTRLSLHYLASLEKTPKIRVPGFCHHQHCVSDMNCCEDNYGDICTWTVMSPPPFHK